jgi:hypothetical protein
MLLYTKAAQKWEVVGVNRPKMEVKGKMGIAARKINRSLLQAIRTKKQEL